MIQLISILKLFTLTLNIMENPTVPIHVKMPISVPEDFGQVDGTPISNKDTILSEVDTILERPPASVEYVLCTAVSNIEIFGYGLSFNSYGHSAVRYTDPDGNDIVMNIEGKVEGKPMVQFRKACDYFYGTNSNKHGTQKGAMYNRHMVTIRIEHVDPEGIKKMHEYFLELEKEGFKNHKKFNIAIGPLLNTLGNFITLPEYGNCAKWVSEGLLRAGVVTSVSMWPKSVLIDMFENYKRTKTKTTNNMNIVYYYRPEEAKRSYGTKGISFEGVAPLQPIRSFLYSDMTRYANALVYVKKGSITARPVINPFPKTPSTFRNVVNNKYVVTVSVFASCVGLRYGYKRINFAHVRKTVKDTFTFNTTQI